MKFIMKAIICTGYGAPEVLQLEEVAKPVLKDTHILVRIHATSVASGDCVIRSAGKYGPMLKIMFGFKRPRQPILGTEFSGVIEAVGKKVKKYTVGDQIFALTGMKFGGYAEYASLPEDGIIALKPENASFEEAATLAFGGTTALHFLRNASIKPHATIMIYGASGSVGSAAIQLANYYGAIVTGVCSATNFELVKSLGATNVLDYSNKEFQQSVETYDIIFDAVGKLTSQDRKRFLKPNGKFVSVAKGIVKERKEDMAFLAKLFEEGKIKATIDKIYSLEEAAAAHRYADTGRKKGNLVLTIS